MLLYFNLLTSRRQRGRSKYRYTLTTDGRTHHGSNRVFQDNLVRVDLLGSKGPCGLPLYHGSGGRQTGVKEDGTGRRESTLRETHIRDGGREGPDEPVLVRGLLRVAAERDGHVVDVSHDGVGEEVRLRVLPGVRAPLGRADLLSLLHGDGHDTHFPPGAATSARPSVLSSQPHSTSFLILFIFSFSFFFCLPFPLDHRKTGT